MIWHTLAMPRTNRIEYEGAFHHVMNRGRSHPGSASFSICKIRKEISEGNREKERKLIEKYLVW